MLQVGRRSAQARVGQRRHRIDAPVLDAPTAPKLQGQALHEAEAEAVDPVSGEAGGQAAAVIGDGEIAGRRDVMEPDDEAARAIGKSMFKGVVHALEQDQDNRRGLIRGRHNVMGVDFDEDIRAAAAWRASATTSFDSSAIAGARPSTPASRRWRSAIRAVRVEAWRIALREISSGAPRALTTGTALTTWMLMETQSVLSGVGSAADAVTACLSGPTHGVKGLRGAMTASVE